MSTKSDNIIDSPVAQLAAKRFAAWRQKNISPSSKASVTSSSILENEDQQPSRVGARSKRKSGLPIIEEDDTPPVQPPSFDQQQPTKQPDSSSPPPPPDSQQQQQPESPPPPPPDSQQQQQPDSSPPPPPPEQRTENPNSPPSDVTLNKNPALQVAIHNSLLPISAEDVSRFIHSMATFFDACTGCMNSLKFYMNAKLMGMNAIMSVWHASLFLVFCTLVVAFYVMKFETLSRVVDPSIVSSLSTVVIWYVMSECFQWPKRFVIVVILIISVMGSLMKGPIFDESNLTNWFNSYFYNNFEKCISQRDPNGDMSLMSLYFWCAKIFESCGMNMKSEHCRQSISEMSKNMEMVMHCMTETALDTKVGLPKMVSSKFYKGLSLTKPTPVDLHLEQVRGEQNFRRRERNLRPFVDVRVRYGRTAWEHYKVPVKVSEYVNVATAFAASIGKWVSDRHMDLPIMMGGGYAGVAVWSALKFSEAYQVFANSIFSDIWFCEVWDKLFKTQDQEGIKYAHAFHRVMEKMTGLQREKQYIMSDAVPFCHVWFCHHQEIAPVHTMYKVLNETNTSQVIDLTPNDFDAYRKKVKEYNQSSCPSFQQFRKWMHCAEFREFSQSALDLYFSSQGGYCSPLARKHFYVPTEQVILFREKVKTVYETKVVEKIVNHTIVINDTHTETVYIKVEQECPPPPPGFCLGACEGICAKKQEKTYLDRLQEGWKDFWGTRHWTETLFYQLVYGAFYTLSSYYVMMKYEESRMTHYMAKQIAALESFNPAI